MPIYTNNDVEHGAGAFEQALRNQQAIPGHAPRMTPGVAVGVLSAAMRSGLPARKIDEVIDREFAHSASLLKRVLGMYEGDDWDIHLWHCLPTSKYKLCTVLCRPDIEGWRYDPSRAQAD